MNQKAKGPAEAATSPDRGSNLPQKETKMNKKPDIMETSCVPVSSRRTVMAIAMAIAAAGPAATLPAVALAKTNEKTSRLPESKEHPWKKVRRLADELSAALNDVNGGGWFTRIYPSEHAVYREFPIHFGDINADERWKRQCAPDLSRLIDEHRIALSAFDAACSATDTVLIGGEPSRAAVDRRDRARRAENAALKRLLSYVPYNDVTRAAKVEYLTEFSGHLHLDDDQMEKLLWSMCGSKAA